MYLESTTVGPAARTLATQSKPLGPAFPGSLAEKVEKIEIWCSSFADGGDDFCLFKAFDGGARLLAESRVAGY